MSDVRHFPMNEEQHNTEEATLVPLNQAIEQTPDPLLEELNVIRIEGRYFCFDKHEAKNRKGVFEYRDGKRGLIIEVSPRFGHPSLLAYKVLQAVFRKITLEGKPYPDTVSFSYRELGRLIGRDIFGGRDAHQLFDAIRQLEDTKVELFLYDNKDKVFQSYRFSIVIGSGFIAEGEVARPERLKAAALTIHPVIADSMRRGHFAIFNWNRLSTLEPLTAAIYKRLYLHFSNLHEEKYDRRSLKFEKDYADVCGEWLGGLKPERYKSRITKQLGEHFKVLQDARLIRAVTIEPKADKSGFKLVFRPGAGFFHDYEHFYLGSRARVLQFQQAADRFHIHAPLALVADFYKKLHHTENLDDAIFPEKDVEYAKRLINTLTEEDARDLIEYALTEAPKTNFAMRSIRAVENYLPAWQANKAARAENLERQRGAARREDETRTQREYDEFCRSAHFTFLEQCSSADRAEIDALARERASARHHISSVAFGPAVRVEELAIIRERNPLPSFEDWQKMRG